MPKRMEEIKAAIWESVKGKVNPKTKKPYVESDAYAIATATYKREQAKNEKGVPKKDGSGGGIRLNKGRGGCDETEEIGKGMNSLFKKIKEKI